MADILSARYNGLVAGTGSSDLPNHFRTLGVERQYRPATGVLSWNSRMARKGQPSRSIVAVEPINPGFRWVLSCGHARASRRRPCRKTEVQCFDCPPQWTRHFAACTRCGITNRLHSSGGLCWLCDNHRRHPPRDWSDHSPNRQHYVDDHVFDKWNEKSAYLLGVLYAEGWASSKLNRYSVKITVSNKDAGWLQTIADAFQFRGLLHSGEIHDEWKLRAYVTLVFTSKRIHAFLTSVRMPERIPPLIPDAVYHHFVRGYFDGDGSVYLSTQARTIHSCFVGNPILMADLEYCFFSLGVTLNRLTIHRKTNSPKTAYFRLSKQDTKRLGQFMYRDATLYLWRKRARFSAMC